MMEVSVPILWHVPGAAVTLFSTFEDGCSCTDIMNCTDIIICTGSCGYIFSTPYVRSSCTDIMTYTGGCGYTFQYFWWWNELYRYFELYRHYDMYRKLRLHFLVHLMVEVSVPILWHLPEAAVTFFVLLMKEVSVLILWPVPVLWHVL